MADIPLATDDKGNVIGYDGKQWRPPDDVAQDKGGRKAYRFGDRWQIAPIPDKGIQGDALDTAKIAGVSAIGAADDAYNVAKYAFSPGLIASKITNSDWVRRQLGLRPWTTEEKAQLDRFQGQDKTPLERIGAPTDPNAYAKENNIEMTPLRKDIAAATRTGVGTALMGGGPLTSLLSAAGAGVGNRIGGDWGAMIGGVGAPVAALALAPALIRGTTSKVGQVVKPLSTKGRADIAENVIRAEADDAARAATNLRNPPPTLPNAGLTGAEMSGDRGLLGLQRAYYQRPGSMGPGPYQGSDITTAFLANRAQQNQAARKVFDRLGAYSTTDDASSALATKMRAGTYEAALPGEKAAWDAFRKANGGQLLDADPLASAYYKFRRTPEVRYRADLLPQREVSKIRNIIERGATELDEIQILRSDLLSTIRNPNTSDSTRQVTGGLVKVLDDYIANLPVKDPATLPLYAQARATTKDIARTFEDPAQTRMAKAFDKAQGNYTLGASKVAPLAFSSRETFDDAMRIANRNPDVLKELRRYFATKIVEGAKTTRMDTPTGERVLSRAGLDKAMENPVMQYARAKLYDSPAGKKIWTRIENTLARMDSTDLVKPRVGSDTGYNLQKGTVLDGLIMRLAGKATSGVSQSVVNRITDVLYKPSLKEVEGMVASILIDPGAMRVALSKATPGNFKMLQYIARRTASIAPPSIAGAAANFGLSQQEQ